MLKLKFLFVAVVFFASIINAQTRLVLIEQFSNSSCPPCAQSSPPVYTYADNNPENAIVISYHTGFPYTNDSMHLENPIDANQRVSFYSVVGVPYSIMDGNVFRGSSSSFVSNISSNVNNRKAVNPQYDITSTGILLSNNTLTGTFQFSSLLAENANENLIAHIVVIEKSVLKSSYASSPGNNSETEYGYVMRKMFPSAAGTVLINKDLNGSDEVNFSWTLDNIKDESEIRIVAFVQNLDTKEVYQSQLFEVGNGTVGIEKSITTQNEMQIFPNPNNGTFTLLLNNNLFVESITIVNQLGQEIKKQTINSAALNFPNSFQLEKGIYFVKLKTKVEELVKKITVI
jgi:hypothetical protein